MGHGRLRDHERSFRLVVSVPQVKAFDNIAAMLAAAGGTLADVVMRIYIVDAAADDLAPISRVLLARLDRVPTLDGEAI